MVGLTGTAVFLVPTIALAAEEAAATPERWQATVAKALGAATTMGISAMSAGYAQAKIGSAGAGTLAERPEAGTNIIVLQALPEIIALLGFAIAFLIIQ
jgi:V/A-type H+-transporting ATPase subunit K